ncbi:hypothetical protein BH09MYX1_BH09MYX1_26270 [soil metagenome]
MRPLSRLRTRVAYCAILTTFAASCSIFTSLDELRPTSSTYDGGVDASTDVVSSADAADAADAGPLCGAAGESCCVSPLAPCEDGLACNGAMRCVVNDAWVVGEYTAVGGADAGGGFVTQTVTAHYDGTAWSLGKPVITDTLFGAAHHAVQIYQAGTRVNVLLNKDSIGQMFRFNGFSWQECKPGASCVAPTGGPPLQSLIEVPNFGTPEIWIAGSNQMYRCQDGQPSCTSVTNGAVGGWGTSNLVGSSAQDLWYGVFDHVLHFDGTAWASTAVADARSVASLGKGDVWIGDKQLRHFDGKVWSSAYLVDGAQTPGLISSIDGSRSNDAFAVGYGGTGDASFAAHWNGTTWTKTDLPTNLAYAQSVYAPSPIDAFVVGRNGAGSQTGIIAHWDGTKWSEMLSPTVTYPGETQIGHITWLSVTGRARRR